MKVSNILLYILFLKAFQKLLSTSLKPSDMEISCGTLLMLLAFPNPSYLSLIKSTRFSEIRGNLKHWQEQKTPARTDALFD